MKHESNNAWTPQRFMCKSSTMVPEFRDVNSSHVSGWYLLLEYLLVDGGIQLFKRWPQQKVVFFHSQTLNVWSGWWFQIFFIFNPTWGNGRI